MDYYLQLAVNSLITGSIYALASLGLSLSYGILKILNFAHGHLMMAGAYLYYLFLVELGFGVPASLCLTLLGSAAIGFLTLQIVVRPFLGLSPLLPFVTTLALATVLESLAALLFGVNTKSYPFIAESLKFGGIYITNLQIGIILIALLLLILVPLFVFGTPLGRSARAVAERPESTAALGGDSRWVLSFWFILSVILAAAAGILVGYETNLQPTMGAIYTLKAFAALILGGLGSIWGVIAGAYCLGFLENFGIGVEVFGMSIPSGYKDAFAFAIVLLVLLVKPGGLFGAQLRKV